MKLQVRDECTYLCHPEFSSGSQKLEMLKRVQHDKNAYSSLACTFAGYATLKGGGLIESILVTSQA